MQAGSVRPLELANACALFPSLKTGGIGCRDFSEYVNQGLSIDSECSAQEIVEACLAFRLLLKRGNQYFLDRRGKELARRHNQTMPVLSASARDFLLKELYLNRDVSAERCFEFLGLLKVSPPQGTFAYERSDGEEAHVTRWLQVLHAVGFLDVSTKVAYVCKDYLGLLNDLLMRVRSDPSVVESDVGSDSIEIGDFAEERAVEDEKARLIAAGCSELAPLVQRIGHIDRSAGYDVTSFRGRGKQPEKQILIEVKGTRKPEISFIWSRNERIVAARERKKYWLYVYTSVDMDARSADGPTRICDPAKSLGSMGYVSEALDVYVSKPSVRANVRR